MQNLGRDFAEAVGDGATVLAPKAFSGRSIKNSVKELESFAASVLAAAGRSAGNCQTDVWRTVRLPCTGRAELCPGHGAVAHARPAPKKYRNSSAPAWSSTASRRKSSTTTAGIPSGADREMKRAAHCPTAANAAVRARSGSGGAWNRRGAQGSERVIRAHASTFQQRRRSPRFRGSAPQEAQRP